MKLKLDSLYPIGYIIGVIINFYETPSGRSPVEYFISSRSKRDQARFAEVIIGLGELGLSYSRVQFKPLRGKLWEIKFQAPDGGYRMLYVLIKTDEMVILHAFRKTTPKTPLHELEVAEKRMKEVLGL